MSKQDHTAEPGGPARELSPLAVGAAGAGDLETELFQVGGQIDLVDGGTGPGVDCGRSEVQDSFYAGLNQSLDDFFNRRGRHGHHGQLHLLSLYNGGQLVDVAHSHRSDPLADFGLLDVEGRDELEALTAEHLQTV